MLTGTEFVQLTRLREDLIMGDYPEIMTIDQAAEMLQVSTRTVHRMVKQGKMPGRQVGSQWRFEREQLREWVRGDWKAKELRESLTQRELIDKEARRLGVDIPETPHPVRIQGWGV
jgi:excisionase family DNA binding protein